MTRSQATRILGYALLLAPAVASPAPPPVQVADIADLSLEQLTQITVTSVSRHEERLIGAPASIYVITAEDIRRSGATSIPEALRLAPNLHVARADANQYAISSRGSNNLLANKLLVLIDGRTVYTPLFSGVFWDAQDVALGDLDRIEVISGPGATLWGANAVNGVINIITRPARATQGPGARLVGGNHERGATLRYGSSLGEQAHWRVYAKYSDRDGMKTLTGTELTEIGDASRRLQAGFRADWGSEVRSLTIQGDLYRGEVERSPHRDFSGGNLLARWRQPLGADSSFRVQAYYDRTARTHEDTFDERLDTVDFEAEYFTKPMRGHSLVLGTGYRRSRDRVQNSASQAFRPATRTLGLGNVFVQDEIALARSLTLTLGVKAERNAYTGVEWLPSARLAWRPLTDNLLWAALSRAVRAPSRIDRELFVPGREPFRLVASDRFESEIANVAELGYRAQLSKDISWSATWFHHDYPNLRSLGTTPEGPAFLNDIEGTTRGVEGWASYRISPQLRLAAGLVIQDVDRRVKAGRVDLGGLPSLGNDTERKAVLRSAWDVTSRHELSLVVRHVGRLPTGPVPAYTVADINAAWKVSRVLELSVTVQNALDRHYFEWGTRVPNERSLLFTLLWKL